MAHEALNQTYGGCKWEWIMGDIPLEIALFIREWCPDYKSDIFSLFCLVHQLTYFIRIYTIHGAFDSFIVVYNFF